VKKSAYLFLALLLPGLVFVFLKFFGSNKFDIPVYYADTVRVAPYCSGMIKAPYTLPDSVWNYFPLRKTANVALLSPDRDDVKEVTDVVSGELGDRVDMVYFEKLELDSATRSRWTNCVFLAENPRLTVLFDGQGRIRGYYDIRGLDEVDRLRVELKILLEQY